MFILSQSMIFIGIVLQLNNILLSLRLIHFHKAIASSKNKWSRFMDVIDCAMIVLFFVVYIIIFTLKIKSIWIGIILLSGALFVTSVLNWMRLMIDDEKENSLEISRSLIGVIEARDQNLNGHSLQVQELSDLIYRHLPPHLKRQIDEDLLTNASLFHDVGKLGIPEAILNKPGKLDDDEWKIMRTHPSLSAKILEPLKSFSPILPWVKFHHERIDGKGYFSLPGSEIPLGARIISVADTYSAINMKRSYKPGKSYEEAVEIIKGAAGTQLDQEIVDVFCSIPKEEVESCTKRVDETLWENERQE